MPQHHHQTFNQRGELVEERIEDYEPVEPTPTDAERIAALEVELVDMRSRVSEVAAANAEVKAMQDAITGKSR